MRKLFTILGFLSALIATILAVTPSYNLAVTPIFIAFTSGLIVLFLSKKENTKTKTIQYIFLLVIIALSLTIYKGFVGSTDSEDSAIIKEQADENIKDSKSTIEETHIK